MPQVPVAAANEVKPFTAKQGQYLAFIYYYSKIHGRPPAKSDFQRFFRVTPPVVHQMIKTLHAHGFIDREPGKARSITLRLTRVQLPDLDERQRDRTSAAFRRALREPWHG
jgi:DNA-binding MarR family transcriptional regulator